MRAATALHPGLAEDLTLLGESIRPTGMLAARFDAHGRILSVAVVGQDAGPRALTTARRAAPAGITPDGPPGLAITTAAHGGRIHVDSAPGRTEFTVELPAAGPSAPAGNPASHGTHPVALRPTRALGSSA
ncbi:hypothetical protein [Streptomyces sp. NPDC054794]